jgi:hypothetical protein
MEFGKRKFAPDFSRESTVPVDRPEAGGRAE